MRNTDFIFGGLVSVKMDCLKKEGAGKPERKGDGICLGCLGMPSEWIGVGPATTEIKPTPAANPDGPARKLSVLM